MSEKKDYICVGFLCCPFDRECTHKILHSQLFDSNGISACKKICKRSDNIRDLKYTCVKVIEEEE